MPKVKANHLTIHYEEQGSGEPLLLIPYLAADHACYAFQVAEYARHFTCISIDPRGAGETDKPEGVYTTELFADDIAAFMAARGIEQAHVAGLSLGAAIGMWLAAKYPARVRTLSLHSPWPATDAFIRSVVEGWQIMARASSVADLVVAGIFPWCFTPEFFVAREELVRSLGDFVRSRPVQPVDAFLRQSQAVLAHDVQSQLSRIRVPTQITFGGRDALTSTRFAGRLQEAIHGSELSIFENCAHAPIYEQVEEFNARTLAFLTAHVGQPA